MTSSNWWESFPGEIAWASLKLHDVVVLVKPLDDFPGRNSLGLFEATLILRWCLGHSGFPGRNSLGLFEAEEQLVFGYQSLFTFPGEIAWASLKLFC